MKEVREGTINGTKGLMRNDDGDGDRLISKSDDHSVCIRSAPESSSPNQEETSSVNTKFFNKTTTT